MDNRINVNGTVNAIKGKGIGGNLYFVSPNGMVVGTTGVINTGTLAVLTPTADKYDSLLNSASGATKITNDLVGIPLNPSGTIVIRGNINATNDVRLRAGKVFVGANETNTEWNRAKIETGVVDFTGLVNLTNIADAGLDNLTAVRDANTGDISIVADVNLNVSSDATVEAKVVVDGGSEIIAARNVEILAKAENNVSLASYKDADGNTKYVANGEIVSEQPGSTGGIFMDRVNDLTANVEIGKNSGATTIKGLGSVDIKAMVENNFASGILVDGFSDVVVSIEALAGLFTSEWSAEFGSLKSYANVEIGANTNVISLDGDVEILANAKNNLALGTSWLQTLLNLEIWNKSSEKMSWVPALGVNVGNSKSEAVVKVDGEITAEKGNVKVAAYGDNTIASTATIGGGLASINPNTAKLGFAFNYTWGENNAKVEIGNDAVITAKKSIQVLAEAVNNIAVEASITSTERNDAAFVINLLDYSSDANVQVAGNLTSLGKDVIVMARDAYTQNSFVGDAMDYTSPMYYLLKVDEITGINGVENLVRSMSGVLGSWIGDNSIGSYFNDIAKYGMGVSADTVRQDIVKGAVSVGYEKENNTAEVNIAKTAKITAYEDLAINALVEQAGINTKFLGNVEISSDRRDTAVEGVKVMGAGTVFIRDIVNDAKVVLDGGDDSQNVHLTSEKGKIHIGAKSSVESHVLMDKLVNFANVFSSSLQEKQFKAQLGDMDDASKDAMWNAYKTLVGKVKAKDIFETNPDGSFVYKDGELVLKEKYAGDSTNLYQVLQELEGEDEYEFFNDILMGQTVQYKDQSGVIRTISFAQPSKFSSFFGIIGDVVGAVKPKNWTDYDVGSGASHIYKGTDGNPIVSADVAVGVDYMKNSAQVLIGKNTEILAINGDVELKSDTLYDTVYADGDLAGMFKPKIQDMKSTVGASVIVGYHSIKNNSVVVLAEGTYIHADNLSVDADGKQNVVGIAEAILNGSNMSVVGNIMVAIPNLTNDTLISLDDEVKIYSKRKTQLNTENIIDGTFVTGGLALGGTGSGSVGVQILGVDRNNIIAFGDNDAVATLTDTGLIWNDEFDEEGGEITLEKDTDLLRMQKLLAAYFLADDLKDRKNAFFGATDVKKDVGPLLLGSYDAEALTGGNIISITADLAINKIGSGVKPEPEPEPEHEPEPEGEPSKITKILSEIKAFGKDTLNGFVYLGSKVGHGFAVAGHGLAVAGKAVGLKVEGAIDGILNYAAKEIPFLALSDYVLKDKAEALESIKYAKDDEMPSVSVSVAGSVGVNTVYARTSVVADGIEFETPIATFADSTFVNMAVDNSEVINVVGGSAATAKGYTAGFTSQFDLKNPVNNPPVPGDGGTIVALTGGVALNIVTNDVHAQIANSGIDNFVSVDNGAYQEGTLVAAGAAISVAKSNVLPDQTKMTSAAAAASISLNLGYFGTLAGLENTDINKGNHGRHTNLTNVAQNKNYEITGGLDAAAATGSDTVVGVGAVVSYGFLGNDVYAYMSNDEGESHAFKKMENVKNLARTGLTQINAAVGIGIAKNENTDGAVAVHAAAAAQELFNDVFAGVNNIILEGENFEVSAYDSADLTLPEQKSITITPQREVNQLLSSLCMTTVDDYLNSAENSITMANGDTEPNKEDLQQNGNLIVGTAINLGIALGGNGSGTDVTTGAAITVNLLENAFNALVSGSTITLSGSNKVMAESNTKKIGVVAGANVSAGGDNASTNVAVGGSILLDEMYNDVVAQVDKSNIKTSYLEIDAYNKEKYVNVAGYLGFSSFTKHSVGIGLALVQNKNFNNTAARLKDTDVTGYYGGETVIALEADSATTIDAISAALNLSKFGLSANVAVNNGQSNTEAVVEDTDEDKNELNNVKSLTVKSKDSTNRLAVAGNLNAGGIKGDDESVLVGIGAALSWNRIGHWLGDESIVPSEEEEDFKIQTNRALLKGYTISMADKGTIAINAEDVAKFTTAAVGVALDVNFTGGCTFDMEGANSNMMINKTTLAEADVDKITGESESIEVSAKTDNTSLSTSDVASIAAIISGGHNSFAIGGAFAENTIKADTKAIAKGNFGTVQNMLVSADSKEDIKNVSVGLAGANLLGVVGSLATNEIDNDTVAQADTLTVSADKIDIKANSEENIDNTVGGINLELDILADKSVTVGMGASVGLNEIKGDTLAEVLDSRINAKDNFSVNANALHNDKNAVFSGGLEVNVAKDLAVGVAANAIVAEDDIWGTTAARLLRSDVNKDDYASGAVVDVDAKDETILDSKVVDAQLLINVTTGEESPVNVAVVAGAGVICEDLSRTTEAKVSGESGNRSTINAKQFNVHSSSNQDVNVENYCVGVSLAISPDAIAKFLTGDVFSADIGVAVSVASSDVDMKGITKAEVSYVDTDNQGTSVQAEHKDDVYGYGLAAAASLGLFNIDVGVSSYEVNNDVNTLSLMEYTNLTHKGGSGDDIVKATNLCSVSNEQEDIQGGIGLGVVGGVAIWDNDFNGVAKALVAHSNIGTEERRAENVQVLADSDVKEKFNSDNAQFVAGVAFCGNRVRNTINTTTVAEMLGDVTFDGNKVNPLQAVYANDITVNAIENRYVDDDILQVPLGLGLDITVSDILTHIGTVKEDSYTVYYTGSVTEDDIDNNVDLLEKNSYVYTEDNVNQAEQKLDLTGKITKQVIRGVAENELDWSNPVPVPGTENEIKGAHSDVRGMLLNSKNDISITTDTYTKAESYSHGSPDPVSLSGKGINNYFRLHNNNGVAITGSVLTADGNIEAGNFNDGDVYVHAKDLRISNVLNIAVIRNEAYRDGQTDLTVADSVLTSKNGTGDITLKNLDTVKLKSKAQSDGGNIIFAGYLKAETKDKSEMNLKIDGIDGNAGVRNVLYGKNITLSNVLASELTSEINSGVGEVLGGHGSDANADLESKNNLTVNKADIMADRVNVFNGLSDNLDGIGTHKEKLTVTPKVGAVRMLQIGINYACITSKADVITNMNDIRSDSALAKQYRRQGVFSGDLVGIADWDVISYGALDLDNHMDNITVGAVSYGTNSTRNHIDNDVTLNFNVAEGHVLETRNLQMLAQSGEEGRIYCESNDGGIISISPLAAAIENEVEFDTTLNLKGQYHTNGDADIQSKHKTDMNFCVNGIGGSVLGCSGVELMSSSEIKNITHLADAVINAEGTLTVKSNTQFDLNRDFDEEDGDRHEFMVYGTEYGGLINGISTKAYSTVNISNSTKIEDSQLQSKGDMLIGSYGDNKIYVTGTGVSAGILAGGNVLMVKNTITETDSVDIIENEGKSTKLITLDKDADLYVVATDVMSASAKGFSERTFTLVGGADSRVTDNITRNNFINIQGGDLYSYKDVNLYANLDEKNVFGRLMLQESSRCFFSGLGGCNSILESNLNQNSHVIVDKDSNVDAIRNVNIYADKGIEQIVTKTGAYVWYNNSQDYETMSTTQGDVDKVIHRDNYVEVDGKITAGILPKYDIYFGVKNPDGTTGAPIIVVPDEETKGHLFDDHGTPLNTAAIIYTADEYNNFISFGFHEYTDDQGVTHTVAEQEEELYRLTGISKDVLKPKMVDLGETYSKQLAEILDLLGEYGSDGEESQTYLTLKAEEERLMAEMERRLTGNDSGEIKRISENLCVEIPDILASGGNVNIETGTLYGQDGVITANGMQDLNIVNNTSMVLTVNDIEIVNPGGNITFNNQVLLNNNYAERIEALNVVKGKEKPMVISSVFDEPEINISGLWAGDSVKMQYSDVQVQDYLRDIDGNFVLDASGKSQFVNVYKVDLGDGKFAKAYKDENTGKYYYFRNKTEDGNYVIDENNKPVMEKVIVDTAEEYTETVSETIFVPADIYISGEVVNMSGSVHVKSKANDIVIIGAEGGIRGSKITLEAQQGSVTQMEPGATINIGGSPEITNREIFDNKVSSLSENFDSVFQNNVLKPMSWKYAYTQGWMDPKTSQWYESLDDSAKKALENGKLPDENESSEIKDYMELLNAYDKGHGTEYEKAFKESGQYLSLSLLAYAQDEKEKIKYSADGGILKSTTHKDGDRVKVGDGTIAGADVYITGADININGIIQSGYGSFVLKLTDKDEATIDNIKNRGSGVALTDADVLNNERYLIREGGAAWDSESKSFRYEMAAYYNPYTDTVLVPSVESKGGHIYLSGRISSTGDGSIKCLDGVSTITVENNVNHKLAINDLLVNEVYGKVEIKETGLQRSVEITRDGVKDLVTGEFEASQVTKNNDGYQYHPQEGLRYEWVSGERNQTIYTYETRKRAMWWGWADYKDYGSEAFIAEDPDTSLIGVEPPELTPRIAGSYICFDSEASSVKENVLYVRRAYNGMDSGEPTLLGTPTTYTTGFYGCHHWLQYTWTKKNGYSYTNQAVIKADNPVSIDFIGKSADNGFIDITSVSDVTLYGSIGNANLYKVKDGETVVERAEKGTVNIYSNGDIVRAGGNIYARNVDLLANGNIDHIHIIAGDVVNLDALSIEADSNVAVTVGRQADAYGTVQVGSFGGYLKGITNGGGVSNLAGLGMGTGGVVPGIGKNPIASAASASLTADGDILRATSAKHGMEAIVSADRIDLVSNFGKIGDENHYLVVQGGQVADTNNSMSASVNASSENNIYLAQRSGNLRAGRIESKNGDLYIEVPTGGIVDAQMTVVAENETETRQDLISEWASLGMVDDGSEAAAAMIAMKDKKIKDDRAKLIEERDFTGTSEERKAEINAELEKFELEKEDTMSKYNALIEQYDNWISITDSEDEKNNLQTQRDNIERAKDSYSTQYDSVVAPMVEKLIAERDVQGTSAERIEEINQTLAEMPEEYTPWNAEQMLYAMQGSIFNPETGVTTSLKDPNLYGRNINLKVKNNVGILGEDVRTINLVGLYEQNADKSFKHIDDIRAISWADVGTTIYDAEAKTITIVDKIAVGLQQHNDGTTGKLTVTGYGDSDDNKLSQNVFLEGRKFQDNRENQYYDLNVNEIKSAGDIRIISLGDIFSAAQTGKPAIITDSNLFISVGDKDVTDQGFSISKNADGELFAVQVKGNTQLLATGDIHVKSIGDINVLDIVAGRKEYENIGGIIELTAVQLDGNLAVDDGTGNILGVYVQGQDVQGNIRSDNGKSISLVADGSIGSWTDSSKTIRLKNVADTVISSNCQVSLTADKEIVLEGVSPENPLAEKRDGKYQVPASGKLVIGELESITSKKVRITANGTVEFIDDSVDFGLNNGSEIDFYGTKTLTASGTVKADTIVLSGATGIHLAGAKMIGTNVTLQTGVMPELTAGVVSVVNENDIKNADVWNSDQQPTPTYSGGVQAVNLSVKAMRDIDLGGTDMLVDNADLSVQRNVIFLNESVSGFIPDSKDSSVKVYNPLDTGVEQSVTGFAKIVYNEADGTLVTKNLGAFGNVEILSAGSLLNDKNSYLYSKDGIIEIYVDGDVNNKGTIYVNNPDHLGNTDLYNIRYAYIGCTGEFINNGTIGANDAFLLLMSREDLINRGEVYSNDQSIFFFSKEKIQNLQARPLLSAGVANGGGLNSDDGKIISAGKHVVMCAVGGLENETAIISGYDHISGTGNPTGGDVILDDFEAFSNDGLLNGNVETFIANVLESYGGDIEEITTDYTSIGGVHNSGKVIAYKGTERGLIHFDSQAMTENDGAIYSYDGEVFMDSTTDLINHSDIYVINSDTTGTVSCNVTLQATGNVYNTGDIFVKGKGAVLMDADSMDQDGLDYGSLSPAEIASHLKTSEIDLLDDNGNFVGTKEIKGIYNTGNIFTSDGDVSFTSLYGGDIYNTDELTDYSAAATVANGNILMNAPLGSVTNTKALHAKQNIDIECYNNIYNLVASNETSPTEFEGETVIRGLVADNGYISLKSNNGAIVNDGVIETKNGDIILEAHGYVTYKRQTDTNNDGKITMDDIQRDEEGNIILTEIMAGIYNHTDSDYIANNGNIIITSDYTIDASGSFTATRTAAGDITKGNIAIEANGDASGQNGDIYHYGHTGTQIARDGSIVYNEESYADGDLAYEMVRADGTIKYKAKNKAFLVTDMIATDDVKLVYDKGTNIAKDIICMKGDVTIITKGETSSGDLTVSAKIKSAGAVNLISVGNLTFDNTSGDGSIDAKDDITLTAERDIKIENASKLLTEDGGLEITSNIGGIDVTGDIIAKDFVRLYTKGDNVTERAGDYKDRFDNEYTGSASIPSESIVSPGIKVNGDISTQGSLDIASYADDISLKNLVAGDMAAVGTNSGKINIGGTIQGNDVTLYSEKETADVVFGKINVSEKLVLSGNNWDLNMGNVNTDGNGFDLYVYGAVGADGSVNPTRSIKMDYRNLPGSESKDVRIRQLNTVNAEIYADGALTIDNMNTSNAKIHTNGAVNIGSMSTVNAEIYTGGALTIDSLIVADKVKMNAMGTKTDIYGIMQGIDRDADFIHYVPEQGGLHSQGAVLDLSPVFFGYNIGDRKQQMDILGNDPTAFVVGGGADVGNIVSGGAQGRRFEQTSRSVQHFDSILLADGYNLKSYRQRFSVEDLMIYFESIKTQTSYDTYFNNGLEFFERYNIIDMSIGEIQDILLKDMNLGDVGNIVDDTGDGVVIVDKEKNKDNEE